MALYSKLLLSSGGGIISTDQQAEQVGNTATVIIGLGGTGVHCIRTIKTQVRNRLKPDDPDSIVPEYAHIRFLGVDTTMKSKGGDLVENPNDEAKSCKIASLDDTEFFPIGNKNVKRTFENPTAFERKEEFAWLYNEKITANMNDAGAGGIRQLGRFMMMDKSNEFMSRLEHELNSAMSGLNNPQVNIHIFSGLSGGTGSGCFLDVCYMVREIAAKVSANVFGYFFLPDVNLSNVPLKASNVHGFIKKNGYAAMQELDYCMNLKTNGGKFSQVYQGHKIIDWKEPPVDMCHLICATDKDHNVIPNAYDYAMNVAAEYIMDFLTNSDEEFGLKEHLANFVQLCIEANNKKIIGSDMSYCVIGASCASLPLREINTYLASGLFDRFSKISTASPTQFDVEKTAIRALAPSVDTVSAIYDSLLREIRENATVEYAPFQGMWQDVRDYGNSDMVTSYTNQTAQKLNALETNAKSMVSDNNKQSLVKRVDKVLLDLCRDYETGPIFANRIIDAAESHNLLNIIDGLIAENESRWNQEGAQTDLRFNDYNNAKTSFEIKCRKALMNNAKKEFGSYEYYLMLVEQHKLAMKVYEQIDDVLRTFRKQIIELSASFYVKLARVLTNLIETFKANSTAIEAMGTSPENAFEIPLVNIDEIRYKLDEEIAKINIEGMLTKFMDLLVNESDEWKGEDENRITKLVTRFFVKEAFGDFANKSITSFLNDKYTKKYGTITQEKFIELIYKDWMTLLTAKARPLFNFNSGIWPESECSKLAFLSFPKISEEIKKAANKMHATDDTWKVKESALTDRIFVMSNACGLPLCAYDNCTDYETEYFTANASYGRHYYEGKGVIGSEFNDWRKLPSITPQSVINVENVNAVDLQKQIISSRELYEKANEMGVIDDLSYILMPDPEACAKVEEICNRCNAAINTEMDISDFENFEKELDGLTDIPMVRTEYFMPNDGFRKTEENIDHIKKDHFVSSPCMIIMAQKSIDKIDEIKSIIENTKKALAFKKENVNKSVTVLGDYCDAIFTGVIEIDGFTIKYEQKEFPQETFELCKHSDEYTYKKVPIYQGFLKYDLLPQEIKDEIKRSVDDVFNNGEDEVKASAEKVKKQLSVQKMSAWNQSAGAYKEKDEITEFLKNINKRFQTFCLQNDCL